MQIVIMNSVGYTACVPEDIGKFVQSTISEDIIGILAFYDNDDRTWGVISPNTIPDSTTVNIVSGDGIGTPVATSTVDTSYCLKDDVKSRLLIVANDTTYDSNLDDAIAEASRTVDMYLKPYAIVPLVIVDDMIAFITADIAAAIFKRRHIPTDMDQGWFGQGIKKLQEYITSTYKQGVVYFV